MTTNQSKQNKKSDCIFCKIVSGEIPSAKFMVNRDFIAILDLFPNTKGQTVIISKKHLPSDIFDHRNDFNSVHKGLDFAKTAAEKMMEKLTPSRIALVTEGIFVDHMHFKLFPIYDAGDFEGKLGNEKVFFENFPGYLTTQSGPMWSREMLEGLAKVLR